MKVAQCCFGRPDPQRERGGGVERQAKLVELPIFISPSRNYSDIIVMPRWCTQEINTA